MQTYAAHAKYRLGAVVLNGLFAFSLVLGVFSTSPALVFADSNSVSQAYSSSYSSDSDSNSSYSDHDSNGDDHSNCHTGHYGNGAGGDDKDDHDNGCNTPTPTPNPTPKTGSITVCKLIVDTDGKSSDGSAFASSTFSIPGISVAGQAGMLPTTTFNTPLTLNAKILSSDYGNDAQCVKYDHLAFGDYYYGQEQVVTGSSWHTPQYNDQFTTSVHTTGDFFNYNSQLFDNDPSNDAGRNQNADGDISLSSDRPDRTLIILNTHDKAVPPPTPTPTPIPTPTSCFLPDTKGASGNIVIHDSPNNEINLQNIFGAAGINVNVNTDQTNYQVWKTTQASTTVTVEATFLDKFAGNSNTFGYYVNGDLSTWKPLFREGDSTQFANVPVAAQGQVLSFTVASTTQFGFAIKSEGQGTTTTWATESSLNANNEQHAVVYAVAATSTYAVGFEDLPLATSDKDYNDMVVKVHVGDCVINQPPVITVRGSNPLTVVQGSNATDPGATAHDPEDGDITNKIAVTGAITGTGTTTIDTSNLGTTTITYNVKDSQGLAAVPKTRTVLVVAPTTPPCTANCGVTPQSPIITVIPKDGTTTLSFTQGSAGIDPGATALDPQDGDITDKIIVTGAITGTGTTTVDTSTVGTSTINYDVTDNEGLSAHASRTVIITSPIPSCTVNCGTGGGGTPTPIPGTITVCKMYVAVGSTTPMFSAAGLPAGTFSITLTGASTTNTANFDASTFVPTMSNTHGANDSQCEDLHFSISPTGDTVINYGQEAIASTSATSTWLAPKYNDGDSSVVNSVSDFTTFNTASSSDGQIVLNSFTPTRTLVLLNTFNATPKPVCSDGIDNDGDGKIDAADPQCHTGGNPNNPYTPNGPTEAPPVLTLNAPLPPNQVTVGTTFTDPGATITDPIDGINNPLDPISVTGTVDVNTIGTYALTYNATDTVGLPAAPVTREVDVVAAPTPTCTSNCTPPPTCTSGCGGGGGGPLPPQLVITNEAVQRIDANDALVTWTTNIPATSRVVFDTIPHVAILGPANYGYAFTTGTTTVESTQTSVTVSGLNLDTTTYHFLPASYANPGLFAVGTELILGPGSTNCTNNCGGGGGTPSCTTNCGGGPITPTSCPWYLYDFIHVGWNNNPDEVKKLQIFLRTFENEQGVTVNGVYDQPTVDAVNRFQEKYFGDVLSPWGLGGHTSFVYITTRQKINEIYCDTTYAFTQAQLDEINQYRAYLQSLPAGVPAPAGTGEGEVGVGKTGTGIAATPGKTSTGSGIAGSTSTGQVAGTSTTSDAGAFFNRFGATAGGLANAFASLPDRFSGIPWLPILILVLIAALAIYLLKTGADDDELPPPSSGRPVAPQPPRPTTPPAPTSNGKTAPPPIILPGASDRTKEENGDQKK